MGQSLSKEELQLLQPHLASFDPSALATVVWDAIQEVALDNKDEGFGIHFNTSDDNNPIVTFWDETGINRIPKKTFLEILQYVGECTMTSASENGCGCSSKAPHSEMGCGLHRLKLALDQLNIKIEKLTPIKGDSKTYHISVDSGIETTTNNNRSSGSASEKLHKLRLKSGSCDWVSSDDDVFEDPCNVTGKRRNSSGTPSKGMEAVVNRLPELRSRYENSLSAPLESGLPQRVMSKLKVFSMFNAGHDHVSQAGTILNSRLSTSSSNTTNFPQASSLNNADNGQCTNTDDIMYN